jgi:hypothetical protein
MASAGQRESLDATLAEVETAMTSLVKELRRIE